MSDTTTNPEPTGLTSSEEATLARLEAKKRAAAQAEAEAARKDSIAAFEPMIPVVGGKEWTKLRADLEAFTPVVAAMMNTDNAGFSHLQAATQGLKHFEAWFLSKVGALAPPNNPPV